MRFPKHTSLGLLLALVTMAGWGCAPRLSPVLPDGITLQPGRFLEAYYRAPDFASDRAVYVLKTFPVELAQEVAADAFQAILQEELTRAWAANGLKVAPQGDVELSGTVQYVDLRGASLRFITGKIYVNLVVSGAVTRGRETLFAFQDRLHVTSPVNPGPAAPKEADLLLHQAARTFAVHLLNELLLYWLPAEGK